MEIKGFITKFDVGMKKYGITIDITDIGDKDVPEIVKKLRTERKQSINIEDEE